LSAKPADNRRKEVWMLSPAPRNLRAVGYQVLAVLLGIALAFM
jgi:hypothetical protein